VGRDRGKQTVGQKGGRKSKPGKLWEKKNRKKKKAKSNFPGRKVGPYKRTMFSGDRERGRIQHETFKKRKNEVSS